MKKEMIEKYLQNINAKSAGVYCYENKINKKIFIGSSNDIKASKNILEAQLTNRSCLNKKLQEDYNEYGKKNFEFKILEQVKKDYVLSSVKENDFDEYQKKLDKDAKKLEKKWLDQLNPFDDKGYNTIKQEKKNYKEKLKQKRIGVTTKKIENTEGNYSNASEIFFNSDVNQLKKGYIKKEDKYICLCCGKTYEEDIIYPMGDVYYTPVKMIKNHIKEEHQGMFDMLINMDKKYTGLSDIQSSLVEEFYIGTSDDEISKKYDIAKSTVRNHRFRLKEKQKQAKIFLALMDLVDEKSSVEDEIISFHKTATMIDDRYSVTKKQQKDSLDKFIDEQGKVIRFPSKQKDKLIVLKHIIGYFDYDEKYKEIEVNAIIKDVYDDFVTVRRYLIEYGFLDRKEDGSLYWIKR